LPARPRSDSVQRECVPVTRFTWPSHALAVVAATGVLISACAVFGASEEPAEVPAPVDAGPEVAAPEGAGTCQPPSPDDFAGCKCEPGSIRDCAHGMVGGASACQKGNQRCENGVWATCVGATDPVPEVCFDGIDNNCDGILDNGCLGAVDYEACGTTNDSAPHVVTDKATYAPGDTVQFLVFWTTPISNVHLRRSDGYCAGGSGGGMVASPGRGCAAQGFHAYRRSIAIGDALFNAPTTMAQMMVNPEASPPAAGPCINPKAIVDIDVKKQ